MNRFDDLFGELPLKPEFAVQVVPMTLWERLTWPLRRLWWAVTR